MIAIGQVEGAQQIGLVQAALRGDEGVRHPREVKPGIDPPRPRQLERRPGPQGTVEVEVDLRLRHAADERQVIRVDAGRQGVVLDGAPERCGSSGRHRRRGTAAMRSRIARAIRPRLDGR